MANVKSKDNVRFATYIDRGLYERLTSMYEVERKAGRVKTFSLYVELILKGYIMERNIERVVVRDDVEFE